MINKVGALLKRSLTKWDLVLILFLIICTIASFSLWFKEKPGHKAVVMVDGKIIKEIALENKKKEFKIQGIKGESIIEIEDGRVKMKSSPCSRKICVKMGWIAHEGQMISCIPNHVIVKIIGNKKDEYDALAH